MSLRINQSIVSVMMGAALVSGCASSPTQSNGVSEAEQRAKTMQYFEAMTIESAQHASGSCVANNSGGDGKILPWKTLIDKANACVRASNWKAVETWAFDLSRANIESPWGLYYYSVAADGQHDFSRALWMIDAAMKKSSSQVALYRYQKGRVLWLIKPSEAALTEVETALKLDSTLVAAQEFLGDTKLRMGDLKSAQEHFETALKLSPSSAVAQKGLAWIQQEQGGPAPASEQGPQAAVQPSKQGAKK